MSGFVLVLFALLVLPSGVLTDACAGPGVKISAIAGSDKSYKEDDMINLESSYRNTVNVFCSGPQAKDLVIHMNGVLQPAQIFDSTTLILTLKNLDIKEYTINCTHVKTSCVSLLFLIIGPDITVTSPNVRQKRLPTGYFYFVPITEDYEVVCSGKQAESLSIVKNYFANVQSKFINKTAIKAAGLHEAASAIHKYTCQCQTTYGLSHYVSTTIDVYADHPPAATNFWCIEYKEQVNCSWSVLSKDTTFSLMYTDKNGMAVRVCEDHSNKNNRLCEWNLGDVWAQGFVVGKEFPLLINSCNRFFCANQTFDINRDMIDKLEPPYPFKFLNKNSHGAVVEWYIQAITDPVEFKLTYKLAGREPREFNASTSRGNCTNYNKCVREVDLPCPGTLYELKVYVKRATTPKTDIYWSEPASITFRTEQQTQDDINALDPICNAEEELVTNKDSALYVVKLLAKDFRKGGRALQGEVNAMRKKLAIIEKIKSDL